LNDETHYHHRRGDRHHQRGARATASASCCCSPCRHARQTVVVPRPFVPGMPVVIGPNGVPVVVAPGPQYVPTRVQVVPAETPKQAAARQEAARKAKEEEKARQTAATEEAEKTRLRILERRQEADNHTTNSLQEKVGNYILTGTTMVTITISSLRPIRKNPARFDTGTRRTRPTTSTSTALTSTPRRSSMTRATGRRSPCRTATSCSSPQSRPTTTGSFAA
jgi:hypothetical protein